MKFSIRDLLWLTVVVALGVGWWLDREKLRTASEQTRSVMSREIEQLRFEIHILKGSTRGPVNMIID